MKFCTECGASVEWAIPANDNRTRAICRSCGKIHYDNPRVLVVAFLYHQQKLLWTKRGIEPFKGLWAFPSGFLEKGETLQQAVAREIFEETHIRRSPTEMIPVALASVMAMDQLWVAFRCRCETEEPVALTAETADWGWYSEDDAPWEEMAYPESVVQVRQVYDWLREGRFAVRVGEVTPEGADYSTFPLAADESADREVPNDEASDDTS